MPNNPEISERISKILEHGGNAVLATIVESTDVGPAVGAKVLVADCEQFGSFGENKLNDFVVREATTFLESRAETKILRMSADATTALPHATILLERIEAEPRLVVAGAGHVGASLARFAALAGFQVTLVDDRGEFVARELFPASREESINLVKADDWQEAIRQAVGNGRGVSVAIVTRGHKQDEECLRAALGAKPDYVGMIGSKRRTNIVIEQLRKEGVNGNELKKVRAPIGLDIGAVSPEEVALAILAEIVAGRRGGTGAPLSSWRRS